LTAFEGSVGLEQSFKEEIDFCKVCYYMKYYFL